MKTRLSHQQGFSWIELVMIIVIVGILSIIAIPRFFDFGHAPQTTISTLPIDSHVNKR